MSAAASPEAAPEKRARLSAVVPTWNEEERLPLLLASLGFAPPGTQAASGQRADEVIVADGGSSDGTCEVASACGARVVTSSRGRGAQLACGARAAQGELLWFLHADVVVQPGSVEALRRAFEDPALQACGVRQRIDAPGIFFRCIAQAADLRVRLGRVYGDSGLAVRRGAYDAAGGFRELPLFEDLDLARRLRAHGRIRLVEGALIRVSARRWRAEGALRRTLANWLLTLAWALGVAPERLARYYRPYPPDDRSPGGAS